MSVERMIGVVFLAVGLGLGTGGFFAWKHVADQRERGLRADGEVIRLERSGGAYYPWVRFETRNGTPVEFRGSVGSKPPAFEVGEKVEVLYQRDAPEDAHIDSFFENWFLALILGFLGTVFTLFGVLFTFVITGGWRARRVTRFGGQI
jgi:hypothetical protein